MEWSGRDRCEGKVRWKQVESEVEKQWRVEYRLESGWRLHCRVEW